MRSMLVKKFNVYLFLISIPVLMFAQIENFSVISGVHPDFGAVSGTWGHLQFYRPFGVKGLVIEDWKDLTCMSPLSGEPFNTLRQGWMPLDNGADIWLQLHPTLTAPADTTAASTLVNYRQGEGALKDFTLWYHHSLDKHIRYGWTSKLRSHPRVLEATVYDQQKHRFQIKSEQNEQYIQMEIGYDQEVNPLYILVQDSLSVWHYDDASQIRSKLWDGSFEWSNLDSNTIGTKLFGWVQGGLWNWAGRDRNFLSSMAQLNQHFRFLGSRVLRLNVGIISKRLGVGSRRQSFAEFDLPTYSGDNYSVALGLKKLGISPMFPKIDLNYRLGVLEAGYRTYQLIQERIWESKFSQVMIQQVHSSLNFSRLSLSTSAWMGEANGEQLSGFSATSQFHFPGQIHGLLGIASVNNPNDYVFTQKYINWELNMGLDLFDQALHSNLKIWGKHLFDTQLGLLNVDNFEITKTVFPGEKILHLLNYTIKAEVSTVIIGFTDQNLLQDALWSQYGNATWEYDYSIMANQIPNSRFRYFSLIWTFDN